MKPILLLLFSVATLSLYAQSIRGTVTDADGAPVPAATVSLIRDTAVVKFAVTNDKGIYSFQDIPQGEYKLSISHISYEAAMHGPVSNVNAPVDIPAIKLKKLDAAAMQSVVITARKPLVEVKADKTVVNVEGTINAAGNDALELLRRSPGVTVDKDDNLNLAGKTGVQVYIDNRPTPLSGQDLANFLKSLQSTQIEAIEIITNPSARYDAAGNAGIINIRLKKNKAFGTNGSVTAGWQVGISPRYNGSANINHRNRSVNVYGTWSFNNGQSNNTMNIYRTLLDSAFTQTNSFIYNPHSQNYKAGIDITLNKQSSIGAIVNGVVNKPEVITRSRTMISQLSTGTPSRLLIAAGDNESRRNNYNLNLNYNYNGSKGQTLSLNADKGYFDNYNDQLQPNTYFNPQGTTRLSQVIYRMISPTLIDIYTIKGDWEQNLASGKLALGTKISLIETENDFKRFDVANNNEVLDRNRSNRFDYKENISAFYANYNKAFKGVMVQAGLRMENTVSRGISTGEKQSNGNWQPVREEFRRPYLDFFPSAAITFNKNPMNQWSLSYSRRIDRPSYQDLNPFEFKLDEYTSQRGNKDLRPQYTNSIGLTNTFKYKLNTTINYSHVSNMFAQILDTAEKSKSFITKRNLATQDVVSMNVSYPFMYKALTVFANLNANYSMYSADFGNNRKIDADAFGFSAMTQASLKFAKTWSAELTGFYNAPTLWQGTFQSRSLWMVEAGMQKQLFNNRANIKASMADVFNSMRIRATSDFAGQKVDFRMKPETQMFKLTFTYRFGSTTVKAARQKSAGAEDELKRAQGDGGGLGPVRQ